ncbi:UDP-2,3-diacylglucosamine hydrolase-like protein [Methylophaga frappieri]|uniref:UDP-2,3-diacylglucosamine hydrolase-like protein n=1 Tax=Methylophaga frappieri (strain ATCC BAA-2434 / DSM 25690 / JAM7) TaxID=754477 RepID=I1YIA5_METFJ|nr:UDP-2,3-diacylglucosamine diphosphatase [Methylophaga frappieri]AFJ02648.1 UDP-2,3-diacylglucosamine hydrolase-like protein [Methylophaga frappieri]
MQSQVSPKRKLKVRSVWISDIHLGFRGCSAELLLDFLHHVECEYLYLVGDIIDIWEMKKKMFWPQEHNNVIRTLLGKAKHNTKVVYVPGNHDEVLRDYDGMVFGNVEIKHDTIHTTATGRKLLILHGDEFDSVVKISPMLAKIGSRLYEFLLRANRYVNYVRRKMGFSYWSLAAFLKHKVKNAVQYISNFEEAVAHEAARQGVDGVVCGHIHRAEITQLHGIDYYNCGDWVESCTALVENPDGSMEILSWTELAAETSAIAQAA